MLRMKDNCFYAIHAGITYSIKLRQNNRIIHMMDLVLYVRKILTTFIQRLTLYKNGPFGQSDTIRLNSVEFLCVIYLNSLLYVPEVLSNDAK